MGLFSKRNKQVYVVRVAFREPDQPVPAMNSTKWYSYLWNLPQAPKVGDRVLVPGRSGLSNAVVVGLGHEQDLVGHQPAWVAGMAPTQSRVAPSLRDALRLEAPRLHGPVLVPWGLLEQRVEVDGEADHRAGVAAAFKRLGVQIKSDSAGGTEISATPAVLALDPTGRKILVTLAGQVVGQLPHEAVRAWMPEIQHADKSAFNIQVDARVWAVDDDGIIRSRVTLSMPNPGETYAPGPMPNSRHVVLPPGRTVQVTGEEHHLPELVRLLAGRSKIGAVATLHEQPPAGNAKPRVAVCLYGQEVGTLTPATSEHYLPIVRACGQAGALVVSRATVSGNQLKVDVTLNAMRAGELPAEWIAQNVPALPM